MSVGHDEYWSGTQRANVEAARDAGVNLAFFSGNEVYWKTRWEPSIDGSNTPYRTLVCYKETWANAKIDPSRRVDRHLARPAVQPAGQRRPAGERPDRHHRTCPTATDLPITVPAARGQAAALAEHRRWPRSAGRADRRRWPPHTVGYESDEDLDNGFRPAGLIDLSTTTGADAGVPAGLRHTRSRPGTTTHHLTLYRAPSGALVFGAGTIQWAWGLDANHDGDGSRRRPARCSRRRSTCWPTWARSRPR